MMLQFERYVSALDSKIKTFPCWTSKRTADLLGVSIRQAFAQTNVKLTAHFSEFVAIDLDHVPRISVSSGDPLTGLQVNREASILCEYCSSYYEPDPRPSDQCCDPIVFVLASQTCHGCLPSRTSQSRCKEQFAGGQLVTCNTGKMRQPLGFACCSLDPFMPP